MSKLPEPAFKPTELNLVNTLKPEPVPHNASLKVKNQVRKSNRQKRKRLSDVFETIEKTIEPLLGRGLHSVPYTTVDEQGRLVEFQVDFKGKRKTP